MKACYRYKKIIIILLLSCFNPVFSTFPKVAGYTSSLPRLLSHLPSISFDLQLPRSLTRLFSLSHLPPPCQFWTSSLSLPIYFHHYCGILCSWYIIMKRIISGRAHLRGYSPKEALRWWQDLTLREPLCQRAAYFGMVVKKIFCLFYCHHSLFSRMTY